MTHQAHGYRHGRTLVIEGVTMIRGAQGDDLLVQSGAQKLTYAGKATIAGLLDAHAKMDVALIQDGRQPPAGIASIEQQEIVVGEAMQVLEQHLTLVLMHAMQGGGEHQFSARQEESEHQLVGQCGTLDVAGAQAETDGGGIGGDQPQAVPVRHITVAPGLLEQPVIERRNGGRGEFGARLRERLPGYPAQQLCLLLQMSEELVQFGLDALAHAGEHQCDQCRQGQFATTLKRGGMLGIASKLTKLVSLYMGGEIGKQSGKSMGPTKIKKILIGRRPTGV